MRRFLRNKYVLLVLGLVLLGVGLIPSSSAVTCGSHTMHPGDTCTHKTDGVSTGTYTYDQQKADDKHSNVAILIVGGALTAGSLGWIGVSLARRRKPAEPKSVAESVISTGR